MRLAGDKRADSNGDCLESECSPRETWENADAAFRVAPFGFLISLPSIFAEEVTLLALCLALFVKLCLGRAALNLSSLQINYRVYFR